MNKNIRKILIYLFAVVFVFTSFCTIKTYAATDIGVAKPVELVFCNPGEDCSTQRNFTWHSTKSSATFKITLASDTKFTDAKEFNLVGVYDTTTFKDEKVKFYKFDLTVSDLTPNTEYIYKVTAGGETTSAKSFKTAGTSGSFNFIWASDNHGYKSDSCTERVTLFTKLVKYVDDKVDADLLIHSGDNVSYGGSYYCWQYDYTSGVFNNHTWASTTGNHSTYMYRGSANTSASGSVQNTDLDAFFRAMTNNPDNGTDEKTESFWFLYNNILFFSLDSMVTQATHGLGDDGVASANARFFDFYGIDYSETDYYINLQRKWLSETIEKNEGKYQYIIVYQHYPWLDPLDGAYKGPYAVNIESFSDLFDKYGVDLALSGDQHCYYRTPSLYDGEINTLEGRGTVYVGAPQIGDRSRNWHSSEYTQVESDKKYFVIPEGMTERLDSTQLAQSSGLSYFEVTPEGITGHLIDAAGNEKDTYFVKAKRKLDLSATEEKVNESYTFNYNKGLELDYINAYSDSIKKIEIYNGDSLVKEANFSEEQFKNIFVEGLEENKIYNLKIKTTFTDGNILETTKIASTYPYYGELGAFKVEAKSEKFKLSWINELSGDVVNGFALYADDKKIADITKDKAEYEVNIADYSAKTEFKLQALSASGEVIKEFSAKYSVYGDVNLDGAVDKADMNEMLSMIRKSYAFGGNELTIYDQNNDGKIDVLDAAYLYDYSRDRIDDLGTPSFSVYVLDENGSIISTQTVKLGESAITPDYSSSTFDHWSDTFEYITANTVIKAMGK